MNPIIKAVGEYAEAGKQLTYITVDKKHKPSKVIFLFADGTTDELPVECDHQTFMNWWKQTGKTDSWD